MSMSAFAHPPAAQIGQELGTGYYQPLNDQISVLGVFQNHRFVPKKFKWRQQTYRIDKITLVSDIKDGQIQKRLFSVVANQNVYRLEYNRTSESWLLQAVWVEN